MPILIGKSGRLATNASVASSIASSASCATTYFGPRVAGRVVLHRAGRVDQDRDGGAEPFFDLGLVWRVVVGVTGAAFAVAIGSTGDRGQNEDQRQRAHAHVLQLSIFAGQSPLGLTVLSICNGRWRDRRQPMAPQVFE